MHKYTAFSLLFLHCSTFRSTALREEDKTDMALVPVSPNMYNGNGSRHVSGEHEYDTIPDILEQMQIQQLQQMEMVRFPKSHYS